MRYLILTLLLFPSLIFSQEVVYGPAVAYKDKPGLAFDIVGVDDEHIVITSYAPNGTKSPIYVFDRNLKLLREGEIESGYFWKGYSTYNVSKNLMLAGDKIIAFYGNRVGSAAYFYYDVFDLTTFEAISQENEILKYEYPAMVLAQAIDVDIYESGDGWVADISLFGKLGNPGTTQHRVATISRDLSVKLTDEFLHENPTNEGWTTKFGRTDEIGNNIFLANNEKDGKLMYAIISESGYSEKKSFDYGTKKVEHVLKKFNNTVWSGGIYANDKSNYNEIKYDGIFVFSEGMTEPKLIPFSDLQLTEDFNEAMNTSLSMEPLIDMASDGENIYLMVSNNIKEKGGRMLIVKYHSTTGEVSSLVFKAESNRLIQNNFSYCKDGKLIILISDCDNETVFVPNTIIESNLNILKVSNDLTSTEKTSVDLSKLTEDNYTTLYIGSDSKEEYTSPKSGRVSFLVGRKYFRLIDLRY